MTPPDFYDTGEDRCKAGEGPRGMFFYEERSILSVEKCDTVDRCVEVRSGTELRL